MNDNEAPTTNAKILVVEDDVGLLKLQARRLERAGYVVVSVTTTSEAIERVRDGQFDLIVLDERLGGQSGLEMVERLRDAGHDVPTILSTGASDEELILKALRAGVRDFVPKSPGFLEHLLRVVARVLKQVEIERALADTRAQSKLHEIRLTHEREAREASDAANRSKDAFLATLSHELRTPLNAIVGWVSILERICTTDPTVSEGIAVIKRNVHAQTRLIEEVLDLSRIASGKLQLEIKHCDLMGIIHSAVDTARPAAAAKSITLTITPTIAAIHSGPSIPMVDCDPDRMQQVVWNLLSNAVKFTPVGGSVTVSIRHANELLLLTVADNGQGINPDFLPYVFDRFRQEDDTTRRRFGGLGLGLSIVKHLMELHGGSVGVTSDGAGQGATFSVTLPLRTESYGVGQRRESPSAPPTPMPVVRLDGLQILTVDDQADARRLVSKVLEDVGASVFAVSSASEALAILDQHRIDVLVSDLAMPDADGFDLIRAVRAAGHSVRELPAIALTAFADKSHGRTAILGGFQVHVPKPVDPQDLIAVIASLKGRIGPQSVVDSGPGK